MMEETAREPVPTEKPKRSYTLSPLALAQRREAAQRSTGPVTDEGKAASSRNAWKHGEYAAYDQSALMAFGVGNFGKPCLSTCPKYPCSLVDDGRTAPGEPQGCLDKEVYVKAFDAILRQLQTGDMGGLNPVLAAEMAGAVEILVQLREEIGARGLVVELDVFNKDGGKTGTKLVMNPAMGAYIKLLEKAGISLPQLMATPAAIARVKDPDGGADPVSDIFSAVLRKSRGGPAIRPDAVDGEFTEVKR